MDKSVAERSPEVTELYKDWEIAEALLGGTRKMREEGIKYLPQWPNEEYDQYQTRLRTATLFPAFQQTVETLTGKPFSQPITLSNDIPAKMLPWLQDVDLEGRNLHTFAACVMEGALGIGLSGILVDYPKVNARTVAEEREIGARPYMCHVPACKILGWLASRAQGKWTLQQLRLTECVEEPDGPFAVKKVEQVRVLYPGAYQIWRKQETAPGEEETWFLFEEGVTTLPYIPFVPVYGKRIGYMMGVPPMLELAHLNIKHWQSQSDQDTLLHVARVPILVRTGMQDIIASDGSFNRPKLVIGSSAAVDLPKDATLQFCEHTGQAIGAGKISLDDLKDEMRAAGAEMLVNKAATPSASSIQDMGENLKGMCALQRVTLGLQDALNTALQFMSDWAALGNGGSVNLFSDFGAANLNEATQELVMQMQQSGIISKETTFKEAQRRSIINPEIVYDEELKKATADGPAMALQLIAAQPKPVASKPA